MRLLIELRAFKKAFNRYNNNTLVVESSSLVEYWQLQLDRLRD
jgi:hypothetical protein